MPLSYGFIADSAYRENLLVRDFFFFFSWVLEAEEAITFS